MSQRKSKYQNAVSGMNTRNSLALRQRAGRALVKLAFDASPQVARKAQLVLARHGLKLSPIGR